MKGDNSSWKREQAEVGGLSLKAENIHPATATVITITEVDRFDVNDPDSADGKRLVYVLRSEEWPERGYFPNKTGLRTLVDKIGSTPGSWEGERIPLVVATANNPRTRQPQKVLWIAAASDWDDVLTQFDKGRKVGKAKARR